MGERADQIEQQINRTRDDLSKNFYELEQKAKTTFDWRSQFEERPGAMIAIAFGGGLLLSALLPARRSRHKRNSGRNYGSLRILSGSTSSSSPEADGNGRPSPTVEAITAAVLSLGANRLGGIAGDLLSNLKHELSRSRNRSNYKAGATYPSYSAPSSSSPVAENI
jgi:hypothetical protein